MASPQPQSQAPITWLMLLLSATTGLVDAASVLGLGKVFTANMTGNVVFLGFAAAGAPGFKVIPYVVAIIAFMAGALVAGRTGKFYGAHPLRHWLTVAALVEVAMLWVAALVAIGYDPEALSPSWKLYAIIVLTGVAMGFRNATVRQLKVPDMTTTVLTLTITGIAADSGLAGGGSPNIGRRLGAIAAIFGGALVGAVLVLHSGLVLPLALAGLLVLVGTLLFNRHPSAAHPRG